MRTSNAFENFSFYLRQHPAIQNVSNARVFFLHDDNYSGFCGDIVDKLCQIPENQGLEFTRENMQAKNTETVLGLYEQATLVVLFYDNHTLPTINPMGPEYLRPLRECLRTQWKKTLRFSDVKTHFEEVYSVDPRELAVLHQHVLGLSKSSRTLRVTDDFGSDLVVDLAAAKEWTVADGLGSEDILPSEIATKSSIIDGKIFFQGTFLGFFPFARKYGVTQEPLELNVVEGKVVSVRGSNRRLVKDLEQHFGRCDGNRFVDEIGIGTNIGIKNLYGLNSAFEERHPGLHLGLGGARKGSHHLDLIFANAKLSFDDKLLFDGSSFVNYR